jgi:N-acetylglucosaminyl-diphospho-decaprenol L-rhamnosyltransferase
MLDIVIVNYRTPALAIDCLSSLQLEVKENVNVRIWMVDNGSGDDSAQKIAHAIHLNQWHNWVKFRALGQNLGFAGGNNVAIREAFQSAVSSDYVLLLNSDTIVQPSAIRALLQFMDEHPQVGIAGSRLEEPDGTGQKSAFRFPSWRSELEQAIRIGALSRLLDRWIVARPPLPDAHSTDWVSGASMIIRREVFETIGLLDDAYFMYYEEVDFCMRAQQAGWQCWYVPESRVVHLIAASSGVKDVTKKRRPTYWFASRRHFFLKNYGRMRTLLADACWAIGYAIFRVGAVIRRLKSQDPEWIWWDFVRYNFGFKH